MKVFLSSTYQDLAEHRLSAANAIERLGQQGVRMEVFGARPADATEVCFDEIAESDAMVGIYAHRYGHVPAGSALSITEQEYDHARALGKPVFCFLIDDEHPWPPRLVDAGPGRQALAAFKARIQQQVVTETVSTPHDLAFKLASSLGRFLIMQRVKSNLSQQNTLQAASTEQGRSQVARRAARLAMVLRGARVLLVNDEPEQMSHVVRLLQDLQIEVTVLRESAAAIDAVAAAAAAGSPIDAVISDMSRFGVEDEGLRFLLALRARPLGTPVIFTVGRYRPELGVPAQAFGITNRVDECLNLLFDALERGRG